MLFTMTPVNLSCKCHLKFPFCSSLCKFVHYITDLIFGLLCQYSNDYFPCFQGRVSLVNTPYKHNESPSKA